ncbi:MAG: hypothetical protein V9E83_04465 [Baekduia sp.]
MVLLGLILVVIGAIAGPHALLTVGGTLVLLGLVINLGMKRRVW